MHPPEPLRLLGKVIATLPQGAVPDVRQFRLLFTREGPRQLQCIGLGILYQYVCWLYTFCPELQLRPASNDRSSSRQICVASMACLLMASSSCSGWKAFQKPASTTRGLHRPFDECDHVAVWPKKTTPSGFVILIPSGRPEVFAGQSISSECSACAPVLASKTFTPPTARLQQESLVAVQPRDLPKDCSLP